LRKTKPILIKAGEAAPLRFQGDTIMGLAFKMATAPAGTTITKLVNMCEKRGGSAPRLFRGLYKRKLTTRTSSPVTYIWNIEVFENNFKIVNVRQT
jgi:hypothetical protein